MFRALLALGTAMGISTCSRDVESPAASGEDCVPVVDADGGVFTTELWAGQHILVGTITVQVDGEYLAVTYDTDPDVPPVADYDPDPDDHETTYEYQEGWTLDEVHLYVGAEPPTSSAPGRFPYNGDDYEDFEPGFTEYTFYVPLEGDEIDFACPSDDELYYLATHAAVSRVGEDGSSEEETAWGYGTQDPKFHEWGWYFDVTLACDCDPGDTGEVEEGCETAFAWNDDWDHCFSEYGFSRWGWTNGTLPEGEYTFVMRAGAAHCDGGTDVGELTLTYAGGEVSSTFTPYDGYSFTETHVYAGVDPIPTNPHSGRLTVAPGQYYVEDDLSGDIWIIGHVEACGDFPEDYEDWDTGEDADDEGDE